MGFVNPGLRILRWKYLSMNLIMPVHLVIYHIFIIPENYLELFRIDYVTL